MSNRDGFDTISAAHWHDWKIENILIYIFKKKRPMHSNYRLIQSICQRKHTLNRGIHPALAANRRVSLSLSVCARIPAFGSATDVVHKIQNSTCSKLINYNNIDWVYFETTTAAASRYRSRYAQPQPRYRKAEHKCDSRMHAGFDMNGLGLSESEINKNKKNVYANTVQFWYCGIVCVRGDL